MCVRTIVSGWLQTQVDIVVLAIVMGSTNPPLALIGLSFSVVAVFSFLILCLLLSLVALCLI